MAASPTVFERLIERLDQAGAAYEVMTHAPVFTSQEAAAVRGTSLSSGAKALVCKADERWVMFVMPADRRLASRQVRQLKSWRSLRFATPEEVDALTGLKPGSIPPFGSLFGLPTLCDPALAEAGQINFNAGDHARSVSLSFAEYVRVEQPELSPCSERPPEA